LQQVGADSQQVGVGVGALHVPQELNEWWLPQPLLGAGAAAQLLHPPQELTAARPQQSAAASAGARNDPKPKTIISERTCFIELLRVLTKEPKIDMPNYILSQAEKVKNTNCRIQPKQHKPPFFSTFQDPASLRIAPICRI